MLCSVECDTGRCFFVQTLESAEGRHLLLHECFVAQEVRVENFVAAALLAVLCSPAAAGTGVLNSLFGKAVAVSYPPRVVTRCGFVGC